MISNKAHHDQSLSLSDILLKDSILNRGPHDESYSLSNASNRSNKRLFYIRLEDNNNDGQDLFDTSC